MSESQPHRGIYGGLFLITMSTLMLEIALTRIFSVTQWYHFSFMTVSIALFGLSAGAVLVHLNRNFFVVEKTNLQLAWFGLIFAVCVVVSISVLMQIHFRVPQSLSIAELYPMFLTYLVAALPFVMSGICICLSLTRFPRSISKLYCADLVGSALGCVFLIPLLNRFDGPTAVIAIAGVGALGALCYAWSSGKRNLTILASILFVLFVAAVPGHSSLVKSGHPLIKAKWVKGHLEDKHLYEKWNAYSRIEVDGDPSQFRSPRGWGMSWVHPKSNLLIRYLWLKIDGDAGTALTYFDGDLGQIEHLKYDLTNLAHHVKPNADVLVIGSGGGRDVLSALAFNQNSVVAVEFNHDIVKAANEVFGEFTGHLDRHPKVTFVVDEARSFIARTPLRFDIIQSSLIDTWAANAAGAYVLTESTLYTVEGWKTFLSRLKPGGVLSFTRWYDADNPTEMYRLLSLAVKTLQDSKISQPRAHVAIVKNKRVATLLLKSEPFEPNEIATLQNVSRALRYEVILTPVFAVNSTFETIASGQDLTGFFRDYPYNIRPPTDDNPFFFQVHKPENFMRTRATMKLDNPVYVLMGLFVTVFLLMGLCILVPLLMKSDRRSIKDFASYHVYFLLIGLAFILIEISQLQRLIIFLGHPVFGLSTILFSLLLASGIGSLATGKLIDVRKPKTIATAFACLLVALVIFCWATPSMAHLLRGEATPVRIGASVFILFFIGFFMGMPFPIGMKIVSTLKDAPTAWFWGLNGAASVFGSVAAFALALFYGIHTVYILGMFVYLLAVLILCRKLHMR